MPVCERYQVCHGAFGVRSPSGARIALRGPSSAGEVRPVRAIDIRLAGSSGAQAVDSLDPCGVYFGTTGGQVYASPDGGNSWEPIVRDLPAVLSVEVQTLQ